MKKIKTEQEIKEEQNRIYLKKLEYSKKLKNNIIEKQKNKKPTKKPIPKHSDNQLKIWDKDKILYKQVWDSVYIHKCEECGKLLGEIFEDDTGKVLNIYIYSHILTKASYPKIRHIPLNINLLCWQHHHNWEFSTWEEKKKMKIYDEERIKELLELNKTMH